MCAVAAAVATPPVRSASRSGRAAAFAKVHRRPFSGLATGGHLWTTEMR